MKVQLDNSIAILVDIQERLYPFITNGEKVLENSIKLIRGLQTLGMEIVVTEQYRKGLGDTLPELAELFGDSFAPMEKREFSALVNPEILLKLNQSTKEFLIIFGIETHVCILQTALDALGNGYTPVIVADAVGSRYEHDRETALQRLARAGVIITTYESLLFELTVTSEHEKFKEISKIVK